MRRVLSVHHYPDFGGPHNEILTIDSHLRALGYETLVLLPDGGGTARTRLDGVVPVFTTRLHRLHRPPSIGDNVQTIGGFAADVMRIRRMIRAHKPDIVRVHGTHNPQAGIAAWLEAVPIVWVVSGALTIYPRWARALGFLWPRLLAAAILANGEATLAAFPGWGVLADRTVFYYPGIDAVRFAPPNPRRRTKLRRQLGISAQTPVVVCVSQISPMKGTDLLLEVAETVIRNIPEAVFLLVGGASVKNHSFAASVRTKAGYRGLHGVRFLGHRTDVEAIFGAGDVAVITSRSEGTTSTAGEAMACGLPVVTTDVGAIREVVRPGLGYVERLDRLDLIANRLIELLQDPELRSRMGRAGRARVLSEYSPRHAAESQARAYDLALSRSSRQPSRVGRKWNSNCD